MSLDLLRTGVDQIQQQQAATARAHSAYRGEARSAFMSRDAADALDKKLTRLAVNFPRLVVEALAERCSVRGFRRAGETAADLTVWDYWRTAGLEHKSHLAHIDRGLYGAAYVTVWGHRSRPQQPVVMLDNPRTMWADIDPATDELLRAVRVWKHQGQQHALVIEADTIRRYESRGPDLAAAGPWQLTSTLDNPWQAPPTVPLIRRASSDDYGGTGAAEDVLDLADALAKVLQDTLVTSEYHSRPRRWATGLEIVEDDDGRPIDPFGNSRLLQSESPETKFGQLDPATLDGYSDLNAMLTQHIGSLTGLPPHYLGLHGDQPANADSIRASETQLVTRAQSEMLQLGRGWAQVAAWLEAIATETDLQAPPVTIWDNPETTTPAASADAAQKLHGMGVPLRTLLRDPLRYEPHEIEKIVADQGTELARRAALQRGTGGSYGAAD